MRALPKLVCGAESRVLPVSDRSVAMLLELLLDDGRQDLLQAAAQGLAEDPPLAVWTLMAAAHRGQGGAKTLEDLAQRLKQHATEWLHWPADSDWDLDGDSALADRFAAQVTEDLHTAHLARRLAGEAEPPSADPAFFSGLIAGAARWLGAGGVAGGPPPDNLRDAIVPLPAAPDKERSLETIREALVPPAGVNQPPAAAYAQEAARIVRSAGPAEDSGDAALAHGRRLAAEAGRRWRESLPSTVCLPRLAGKLHRLFELESRFQELLETEKLAAMAEFAAGAGHEINNPLTVIGGRAQLLLKQQNDPERRRELALIGAQVKRAYEMIADMRLFARPPQPEPRCFDLAVTVDQVLAELAPQAAQRATSLGRHGEPGPIEIEADPVQIQVMLRALCTNALEAVGYDGRVELALETAGEAVILRVADNGPGISPEQRRHIFDPYYSARQAGRGLGLGLSKCWRIVGLHHGRIDVASQPGQGAVFTVTLPRRWKAGDGGPGAGVREQGIRDRG
jgi:hypothetical protein